MTEFKIGQKVKASGECRHIGGDFEYYCPIHSLIRSEMDDHFTIEDILEHKDGRKLLYLDEGWEFLSECMEPVDEPGCHDIEEEATEVTEFKIGQKVKASGKCEHGDDDFERYCAINWLEAHELDDHFTVKNILEDENGRKLLHLDVGWEFLSECMELVDEPDLWTSEDAREYLTSLHGMNFATSETGGTKQVKPARIDLIPADALRELAEHYGKGVEKYPSDEDGLDNWRNGMPYSLSLAALYRHLNLYTDGVDIDEENGSKHLIAVAWHALNLAHWHNDEEMTAKYDDRQAVIEKRRKEA